VFDDLSEAGFPVHVLHSKKEVEDFIKNVTETTTAPLPAKFSEPGEIYPELGSFSPTGFREDDDIIDDTGGAV
jgi:hypothetical protein